MNWLPDALAFAAACAAGAVNAVAGGGTLISFPALVWLGLPPITANATNAVAIWPGSLGAMWGYRGRVAHGGTLGASAGGAQPGRRLRRRRAAAAHAARTFDRLVPLLILFATLLFMVQEPLQRRFKLSGRPGSRSTWLGGVAVFQFFVSLYGGYFGAGIGILMLAALA